jgi:hypothetical protein
MSHTQPLGHWARVLCHEHIYMQYRTVIGFAKGHAMYKTPPPGRSIKAWRHLDVTVFVIEHTTLTLRWSDYIFGGMPIQLYHKHTWIHVSRRFHHMGCCVCVALWWKRVCVFFDAKEFHILRRPIDRLLTVQ